MKNYKFGIILGIISIVFSLLFTGIPIGNNFIEMINIIVYVIGLLVISYFSLINKNDKALLLSTGLYFIILFLLVLIIESNYQEDTLIAIGFVPGLLISIIGLIKSKNHKDTYKIKTSLIINSIALILSILSILMIFINGGFIIE